MEPTPVASVLTPHPSRPAPAKVVAKHVYASNGFSDTETTVLLSSEARTITLRILAIPGNRWWEKPPAAVLRAWADKALAEVGRKRSGARHVSNYETGWSVSWSTEAVAVNAAP